MEYLKLTQEKLSVDAVSDLVVDSSCGAVSVFVGTTRDNFQVKRVLRLEYEAYESMALKAMKSICDETRHKWPSVHSIAVYHRLGEVPTREASVIIAVSSPHRQESLSAVSHLIDQLKSSVPIWKKEVYEADDAVWKENVECPTKVPRATEDTIDKSQVQINVSSDELRQRIQNFIDRKREQVNISNIHDFIPNKSEKEEDEETCARVRAMFVKRNDSKGHLKIHKVTHAWGPQTVRLPPAIAERVQDVEGFLQVTHHGQADSRPVAPDVYRRLRECEDRIAELKAMSPEYASFWGKGCSASSAVKQEVDYEFSAEDIANKIEQLQTEGNV